MGKIQPQDAQASRALARALDIAVAYLCLQCLFLEIRHHETDLLHNGKSIMESVTREHALGVEHVLTQLDHNKINMSLQPHFTVHPLNLCVGLGRDDEAYTIS